MKKILITGGAGTLGSNIVEYLLPRNYHVLVIDNFSTGNEESLPSGFSNLELVKGSVCDQELIDKCVMQFRPETIIHSAASYKDPDDWVEDARTNVIGSINIIKAAEKTPSVKRVINFQTALCYGEPDIVPIPVEAPVRPKTSYATSKVAGESYMMQSNIPVISLRLSNVVSPRLSIGPIPTFYNRLKESKSCYCSETIRDFLDIKDFLSLLDLVLVSENVSGVFNVSTGLGYSMKDVFDKVSKWLEVSSEVDIVKPGLDDIPEVVLDPKSTMEVFDWKPAISFEQTIDSMLSWYDQYSVGEIYSHLRPLDK